jgi:antitoxin MazE
METALQKWGNSLGVRIPGGMARALQLKDGDAVELISETGRIIIQPTRKESLRAKLKRVSSENLHSAFEVGAAKGKEAW